MNIRTRLTLRFIIIVAVILALVSFLIYVFSADYRKDEFYNRLRSKAQNTAKLFIDVDEVDAVLLEKLEDDNPVRLPEEKIIIFNYKNEKVFTTDKKEEIKITVDLLNTIRLEDEIKFVQDDYELIGFLFKGRYDRFTVVAAAKDIYGFNKLKNLRTILVFVFISSIIIVSVAGWFFSGNALKPISKVVSRVDEITINRLNLRVDEGNGKDEIARLAMTFNNMLARLQGSFIAQRNFIANASHELRTPLTSITGQLEVILLSSRTNEEYIEVIHSVLEDIKNLNTLSTRLLLLAQTDQGRAENKMAPLRVDDLLWEVRDDLVKKRKEYSVSIDMDHLLDDEAKLSVRGDQQLLMSAFYNIMENGCKYSDNHSVDIRISALGGKIRLEFADNGIGIPEADLPNIFNPFFRGSNSKGIRGHGIGLSIVRPILDLHDAQLQVTSEIGKGTVVTVTFPTV